MSKLYKTELHCHTATVSRCAKDTPEHLVEQYLEYGYSTVLITDHFAPWYLEDFYKTYDRCDGAYFPTGFDRGIIERSRRGEATWADKIEFQFAGYRRVKELAPQELTVLPCAEARIVPLKMSNDYLVFGMTPELLLQHPEIFELGFREYLDFCRANGVLLVQAHPFRRWMTLHDVRYIDGLEVFNAGGDRNDIAELWADDAHLIKTSGSDYHNPTDKPLGGILTEERITSLPQLVSILKSGEYELIRDGLQSDAEETFKLKEAMDKA